MEYRLLSIEDKKITAGKINLEKYDNMQAYECSCDICDCACFCNCFDAIPGEPFSGELEKELFN